MKTNRRLRRLPLTLKTLIKEYRAAAIWLRFQHGADEAWLLYGNAATGIEAILDGFAVYHNEIQAMRQLLPKDLFALIEQVHGHLLR